MSQEGEEEGKSKEQPRKEKSHRQNPAQDQAVNEDKKSAQTQQNPYPQTPKTNEPTTGNQEKDLTTAPGSLPKRKKKKTPRKRRKRKKKEG